MNISFEQAVSEITTIVNERPDFVYQPPPDLYGECMYVHLNDDGSKVPGCIIGLWLHRFHNVPLEQMTGDREGLNAFELIGQLPQIEADYRTKAFLAMVQQAQDSRRPWREALEAALEADAMRDA